MTEAVSAVPARASMLLLGSRLAFVAYFVVLFGVHITSRTNIVAERVPFTWCVYLFAIYLVAERVYAAFRRRAIDLTYAFPLMFAVFILNVVSLLVRGQAEVPIINRAEHLASFVLLTYIVWIFFLKYLPQDVWEEHPYYTAILVLAITSMAGVGNEIMELFFDQTFSTRTIGEGFDTSVDLLMNTLGSGLFLAVQLILREGKITFSNSR